MSTEFVDDGKELGCCWHFAPQLGGSDIGFNNAMTQNFKDAPYPALIRECIQNSLDAVFDKTKPVKVEIEISQLSGLNFSNFFEIKEHIRSCRDFLKENPKAVEYYSKMESFFQPSIYSKFGYIRISDYNTQGMKYVASDDDTKSPFYAFVLSEGNSSKDGQESGGSFGFGKAAYFQISPISTILVSTLTQQNQYVFEGVSRLITHKFDGTKVCAVGFYDNNNGKPITNKEEIPLRFLRNEPGTNFYIMGLRDEPEYITNEMIPEVLRSFWYAIYSNRLIVTILGEEINASSLNQYLFKYFDGELDNRLKREYHNPIPYYLAVKGVSNADNVKLFTENLPILGECSLFLIKNREAKDKIIHMRRPLMLVFGKKTQTNYGVYGLFVCNNENGDKILREIENPAHNEWKATNWRNSQNKTEQKGISALDEIEKFKSRCLKELFIDDQDSALEITGLDELLYIPEGLFINDPFVTKNDDGGLLSSDIIEDSLKIGTNSQTNNLGSVRIVNKGTTHTSLSDSDNIIGVGGHSLKKSRTKGGSATAGNSFKRGAIDNPSGTHKKFIPIRFRVIATNEDGKIFHNIFIYSDYNIENGEIEIITIGEQSDDVIDLAYCNVGKVSKNFVTGISLISNERNSIKIRFKDNMRHAIKLKAYEDQ